MYCCICIDRRSLKSIPDFKQTFFKKKNTKREMVYGLLNLLLLLYLNECPYTYYCTQLEQNIVSVFWSIQN